MRKIVILILTLLCAFPVMAYKFTGLNWEASKPYIETGGRNYLPWSAAELENKYGVQVHIFKFNAGTKIEAPRMARAYYDTITKTPESRILLIWVSNKKQDGVIMASDALKKDVSGGYLDLLQDEVLKPLINRWYISDQRIFSKILGTIIYIMEKKNTGSAEIASMESRFIRIDDPLYQISLKQPFYDLIKLFYFEPVSFCLYFPFIMYAFIVRIIGMKFGRGYFIFFNILWAALTGFVFLLILNRVNVLFREYMSMLTFFIGINAPLYLFLFIMYRDRVEAAAYSYLHNITGGFGSDGSFGGSR